jgi:PPP family 3-phenylpropionic acid transporter
VTQRTTIRIFFTAYYAAAGAVIPFLSLFLRRNGLDPGQIGVVLAVHSLAALAAAPFWGAVSDAVASPATVVGRALAALIVTGIALALALPIWVIVLLTTVIAIVDAGVQPLSDRLAVMIERQPGGVSYGSIRVFGSVGWICITPIAGMLADRLEIRVLFAGFALLLVPALLSAYRIARSSGAAPSASDRFSRADAVAIARDPELRFFVGALILHQFVSRSIFRFEPLYLDSLGVRMTMIGVASAIPAIVELAGMPVASVLGRRITPRRVIIAGMATFLTRMILVLLIPIAPVVIASKVLGGVQFAFVLVGTVGVLTERWISGPIGTVLALVTVSIPQVVQLVAFPVSGFLFERYGGAFLYTVGAGASAVAIALLVAAGRGERRSVS